jgi:hypothetical protein
MRRKIIKETSETELNALPTKHLLARLRNLLQCEESISLSDHSSGYEETEGRIEFKDTEKWRKAYQQVKNALAKREHVEKGRSLTEIQQRAQHNRMEERRKGRNKVGRG